MMAFCHLLLRRPLLEGTSGEYIVDPFLYAPTETGIVNPNSLGHALPSWHVRGAASMATPRGSPRGLHRRVEARPLTAQPGCRPLTTLLGLTKGTALKGAKKRIPTSLRHEGQLLLSDK